MYSCVLHWGYEYKLLRQFAMTVEETRSYSQLKQSQSNLLQATRRVFACILKNNIAERQLNALGAGIHELCKQTGTNWNTLFKNSSCGPVALYHKQRNDCCVL